MIRSQAAIQFPNGPAHTTGVPPLKRMSPVNTVSRSGSSTITSPWVWAGPTSTRSSSSRTDRDAREPVNVRVGGPGSTSSNRNAPKMREMNSPADPIAGAFSSIRASIDAGDLVHLAGRCLGGDDLVGADGCVAVAVVAVGVGVDDRGDRRASP